MDKQTIFEVLKDLINKLKVTIDCKVEKIGAADLFTKTDVDWELTTSELTGELELKLSVKDEKPELIEVTVVSKT